MRFSTFIPAILAAATLTLASPVQSNRHGLAGNVLDSNGRAYMLKSTEPGNVKVITNRVDGEWMRPASFFVEQDYFCKFYQEATRGIGSIIGGYEGPLFKSFDEYEWAVFYECYKAPHVHVNARADITDVTGIPPAQDSSTQTICGRVSMEHGGQFQLNEGGVGHFFNFAINGEAFTPLRWWVDEYCECRFYSARTIRGGSEVIAHGKEDHGGTFGQRPATKYQCWAYKGHWIG